MPHRVPMDLPDGPQNQTRSLQSQSMVLLTEDLILGDTSFRADGRDWPMDESIRPAVLLLSRVNERSVAELTDCMPPVSRMKLILLLTSLVLRGVLYRLPAA